MGRTIGASLAFAVCAVVSGVAFGQIQTPEAYVAQVGGRARVVAAGDLHFDGRRMQCGQRPTVLDAGLDDFAAAYPGFMVFNPDRIDGVAAPVKFWIYAQACGFQFGGPDAARADCFAVKRGRQQAWLDQSAMDQICRFIEPTKGDAANRPGVERCAAMRVCFAEPIQR